MQWPSPTDCTIRKWDQKLSLLTSIMLFVNEHDWLSFNGHGWLPFKFISFNNMGFTVTWAHLYLTLVGRITCLISWEYFAHPTSLRCRPSDLYSDFLRSCDRRYQFLRLATSPAINLLTSMILLLSAGLSWRNGISAMMTVRLTRFRDKLSITWRISSMHCLTGWSAILLLPAARTVMSLVGMFRNDPFIWRAVLPGWVIYVTRKIMIPMYRYYTAYMDYMDFDVCRVRKAIKLNHSPPW